MHDWILVSILVEWAEGTVTIKFDTAEYGLVEVNVSGLVKLYVPQFNEWGPSVVVNEYEGPIDIHGHQFLSIEMQSGDKIELEAKCIIMPF